MSAAEDIHGARRLPVNVLTSWAAQSVQLVTGFVVPRLIDRNLGQETLGLWDFAWSLVAYFGMVQVGVVSSINRYVAMYRGTGKSRSLNEAASSVAWILRGMGAAIVLLSVICSTLIPLLLRNTSPEAIRQARWLVLLLGCGLAVQVVSSVYSGVITGCHRWDLHNGVYGLTNILLLAGMVGSLSLGFGIVSLAITSLTCEAIGRGIRVAMAYRVCPELQIKWTLVRRETAGSMLGFGGKTFATYISQLLLNQTTAISIAVFLGPAALALYARPVALVRSLVGFVQRFAMVLTPTTSSLWQAGKVDEIHQLMIRSTKFNLVVCGPILLTFALCGDLIMRVWMGPKYAHVTILLPLLVCGFGASIVNLPLHQMLAGVDRHGRAGAANMIAAALASVSVFVALKYFYGGLVTAAAAVAIPLVLVSGIWLPLYACRTFGLSVWKFAVQSYGEPLLLLIPFVACLAVPPVAFDFSSPIPVVSGFVAGCALYGALCWALVLPISVKTRVLRLVPGSRVGACVTR